MGLQLHILKAHPADLYQEVPVTYGSSARQNEDCGLLIPRAFHSECDRITSHFRIQMSVHDSIEGSWWLSRDYSSVKEEVSQDQSERYNGEGGVVRHVFSVQEQPMFFPYQWNIPSLQD
jgi:hypothetical protein